jgi:hypothetical protein
VRQELEGLIKCMEDYFQEFRLAAEVRVRLDTTTVEFWTRLSRNFTNIEARQLVLRTALGEGVDDERDVRDKAG